MRALGLLLLVWVLIVRADQDEAQSSPVFKSGSAAMHKLQLQLEAQKVARELREVQREHTHHGDGGGDQKGQPVQPEQELGALGFAELGTQSEVEAKAKAKAKTKARAKASARLLDQLGDTLVSNAEAGIAESLGVNPVKNPMSHFVSNRLKNSKKASMITRTMLRHRGNLLMRYMPDAYGVGAGGKSAADQRVPMAAPSGPFTQAAPGYDEGGGRVQSLNAGVGEASAALGIPGSFLQRGKVPLPFDPQFAFNKPQAKSMGDRPAEGAFSAPAGNYMNQYHILNPFTASGQASDMPPELQSPP